MSSSIVAYTLISSDYEEPLDAGSPRVVVYGYDGLPMHLVDPYIEAALQAPGQAPSSPDYVPGPEEPKQASLSLDYDYPLPDDASPTSLSPGYIADSDPEEDPKEDPADYPDDGGDDTDDESSDDDDDDVEKDGDEEEEEEHLASADSFVVPTVDHVPLAEDTEAFKIDESAPTLVPSPGHCKKNIETLNSKITDLTDKLFDANNMIYHYKLALAQVESRLVEYKEREVKYIEKIRTLEYYNEASKDLDNLIESQRSYKNKEGLGYTVVPPLIAQLYLSPKKDLSWTCLPECADDTVTDYSRPSPTVESTSEDDQNINSSASENGESSDSILSKPTVKFVKAAERSTTNKVETVKKPSVRYAKLYRKPSKKSTVGGTNETGTI
nr:hypothetical protein [Tanacetum cinerariifolium]